jgi:hypothetical protein
MPAVAPVINAVVMAPGLTAAESAEGSRMLAPVDDPRPHRSRSGWIKLVRDVPCSPDQPEQREPGGGGGVRAEPVRGALVLREGEAVGHEGNSRRLPRVNVRGVHLQHEVTSAGYKAHSAQTVFPMTSVELPHR